MKVDILEKRKLLSQIFLLLYVVFFASGWQKKSCSTQFSLVRYCTSTISCASLPISLASSNCKLNIPLSFYSINSLLQNFHRDFLNASLDCTVWKRNHHWVISYGITAHLPGHFDSSWFNQVFFRCKRRFCLSDFPSNSKRSLHCFTVRAGYSSSSSRTINTSSLYLKLFTLEKLMVFINIFYMFCLKTPS